MNCKHCKDTGIIETGNNDLPCDDCPAGDTAIFNTVGGRKLTGAEVRNTYNPVRLVGRRYVMTPEASAKLDMLIAKQRSEKASFRLLGETIRRFMLAAVEDYNSPTARERFDEMVKVFTETAASENESEGEGK